ncbi:MAG: ABC transporter permease [Brevinema sp.]
MKQKKQFYDMFPLSSYLAFHRLLPKSNHSGTMLLPKLAFLSIVVGVAASILILSLANGLHHNQLTRLAGQDAHVSVISIGQGIPAYEELIARIKQKPCVVTAYPYTQHEALLKSYSETKGIILRSLPKSFINDIDFNGMFRLHAGVWSFDQSRSITIGKELADNYSLFVGESIDILAYDDVFGSTTYRFKIVGIFTVEDSLISTSVGFINIDDAVEIFGTKGYIQNIGIRIKDYMNVQKYYAPLKEIIPYNIKTWQLENLNTLLALENDKRVIQVVLIIFFCVAFFAILSVMTALVADKREEIALLKALGITPNDNFISFIYTGLFLGISGSLIGIIIGLLISISFNKIIKIIEWIVNNIIIKPLSLLSDDLSYGTFTFLNQSVYYLKEFPILIKGGDIIFVASIAITCTLLAAIYPAFVSKNYRPAEILRKRAD